MLVPAVCLTLAGLTLSLVARVPLLLGVMAAVGLSLAVSATLPLFGLDAAQPAWLTLLVSLAALQAGYGIGVIARGTYRRFFRIVPPPAARSARDEAARR
ncbi:hypothetical protein [Methylobacterium sp. JK268]